MHCNKVSTATAFQSCYSPCVYSKLPSNMAFLHVLPFGPQQQHNWIHLYMYTIITVRTSCLPLPRPAIRSTHSLLDADYVLLCSTASGDHDGSPPCPAEGRPEEIARPSIASLHANKYIYCRLDRAVSVHYVMVVQSPYLLLRVRAAISGQDTVATQKCAGEWPILLWVERAP